MANEGNRKAPTKLMTDWPTLLIFDFQSLDFELIRRELNEFPFQNEFEAMHCELS